MFFKYFLTLTFILIGTNLNSSEFKLKTLSDENAICNNGENANYWIADQGTNKWLIQLPGGGAAWDIKTYNSRDKTKKENIKKPDNSFLQISSSAIASQLYDIGYNVIKIHYCSSDLYAGDHYNSINNKKIPFKGRVIISEILKDYDDRLNNSKDTIVAGTSAGVYGILLNLDLFSQLNNSRFILDSIWRDSFQQSLMSSDDSWVDFPLGKMPDHCKGDFYSNCSVNLKSLSRYNINDAFIIFNFGDPYNWAKKDEERDKFFEAIDNDIKKLSGGFSIDAKKYKLSGAEKWGHGLISDSKFYNKNINETKLSDLVLNWVNKDNNTSFILK